MNTETRRIQDCVLRWVRLTFTSMLLTCMLGLFQPGYADGIYRLTSCFQNSSLRYDGTGFAAEPCQQQHDRMGRGLATSQIVNGKPVCGYADPKQVANLFGNSAAGGTNKFMENFPAGMNVAPQGFMLLSVIAPKNTTLVKGTATLYDVNNNNAPVQTKLNGNLPSVKADPILDFTNTFSESETLDFIGAFINNSQDPLNAFINFVADGTAVSVTSSAGCGVGAVIAPMQTCEFSFDLPADTTNWAFEIFADSGGSPIFDLVATTTTPEPPGVVLSGLGLLGLSLGCRRALSSKKFRCPTPATRKIVGHAGTAPLRGARLSGTTKVARRFYAAPPEASGGYRLRSTRNLKSYWENRRQVQMSPDLVRDLAGRQIPNIGIKALFGNNLSSPSLYLDDPNATPCGRTNVESVKI